jgi:hypothetical protein
MEQLTNSLQIVVIAIDVYIIIKFAVLCSSKIKLKEKVVGEKKGRYS